MVRERLPISTITSRKINLEQTEEKSLTINYETVRHMIEDTHRDNIHNIIDEFFNERSNDRFANESIVECVKLTEDIKSLNEKFYNENATRLISRVADFCTPGNILEASRYATNDNMRELLINKYNIYEACDRVIFNTNKISNRFDLAKLSESLRYNVDPECVIESLCDFIDTYKMPVDKKVLVSLEESLYLYNRAGIKDINHRKVMKTVVESYLKNNSIITDKEMNNIKNIIDREPFFIREDAQDIFYIFNEANQSYKKVILIAYAKEKNPEYKSLLKRISECNTIKIAKAIIKDAFKLIKSTFIIGAVVAITSVVLLISALYSLALVIGSSSLSTTIKEIKAQWKSTNSNIKDEEEKKRAALVDKEIKKQEEKIKIDDLKTVVENNILFEDTDITKDMDPDDEPIHEDPDDCELMNPIEYAMRESKDFADSNDVSDLIKRYKADQNKNVGKLKTAITRIYAKKPEQIIDETPHILEFIRNFGILSSIAIPMVGPVVSLVTFCTDKYIAMGLKRKETDKIYKYFNNEKNKVETKIDRMSDGKRKTDLETYLACLNKSIDKIDLYRDSLYSEKELDDMNNSLLECALREQYEPIAIEDYITYHNTVCMVAYKALSLLVDWATNSDIDFKVCPYENISSESSTKIDGLIPIEKLPEYVTPDGLVNIPLMQIDCNDFNNEEINAKVIDACSNTSDLLSHNFIVSYIQVDCYIYITLYYLRPLDIECTEMQANCLGKDAILSMYLIKRNERIVEHCTDIENDIISELCGCIDELAIREDLDTIMNVLYYTGVNSSKFEDNLKDYSFIADDPKISDNINKCKDVIKPELSYNNEGVTTQLEAVDLIKFICEDVKKNEGKGVDKLKKDVADVKKNLSDKVGNIGNRTKDGKIAMTTNIKLAAEAMKKKAQSMSTKEQEISRNLDMNMNAFKRGVEKAVVSDRREAIIKGSIIPSFSKTLKIAIATPVAFAIAPVATVIAAIGALGMSKSLTAKERQMMLDEISIELKVLDKEIENADRDGDTKKYRQLLTYQRKLQREAQRIKYRLKVYSKDVPDAEV